MTPLIGLGPWSAQRPAIPRDGVLVTRCIAAFIALARARVDGPNPDNMIVGAIVTVGDSTTPSRLFPQDTLSVRSWSIVGSPPGVSRDRSLIARTSAEMFRVDSGRPVSSTRRISDQGSGSRAGAAERDTGWIRADYLPNRYARPYRRVPRLCVAPMEESPNAASAAVRRAGSGCMSSK